MTLSEWMETANLTYTALAEALGVDRVTVHRYFGDEPRVPTARVMLKIVELSKGAVTPNDFYGIDTVATKKRRSHQNS